ncbi:DUF4129 domain-containing protein [Gulosibacter faecalis]|jgi:hypothetical protein|uniref:DUF4129 domain-containing protein n=1 Tax=Gulosibacter faecalis TaxID=272240 RepID=A0ABW5UZM7_9MICO|nr:DUF4129 domain-containing protein [Gulosibacter faecalis]
MTTPITPDEDTARDWLLQELSKAEYQEAKPNPIDELFNAIWEWFASLFEYTPNGVFGINPAWIFIILGIILLVVLFVIFGRPRAVARRRSEHGAVFLENDTRTVAELRDASERAAGRGDWSLALTERYRAIARALADRTLIRLRPGTTAQGVAAAAAGPFPGERDELRGAATAFDAVRYAEHGASADDYERVRTLDARLDRAHPNLAAAPEAVAR